MALFRNFYRCANCGHEWTDDWSAMCDDDCPHCGARHMSPYKSEDIARPKVKPIAPRASDRMLMIRALTKSENEEPARFRNFYKCANCDREWTDNWSATCDDDCPHCGA